jgi:hypothetical protein
VKRRSLSDAEKLERRLLRYADTLALVEAGEAPEQTRVAVDLLREGLIGEQIAERMGISRSRVYELLNDPLGTKTAARKARGQRRCLDCGTPCNTNGRVSEPAVRCKACARARQSADAKWQAPQIIEAIQRWAAEHGGVPPKATEWNAGAYAHPDYLRGDWPAYNTCSYRFGTFNEAVKAAGFTPFRELGGQPRRPLTREQLADTAALVQEHGLKGAATVLGMTPEGVKRRMKQFNNEPIGDRHMPATLTADAIIERELEKQESKAARLREELEAIEKEAGRLKIARDALRQPLPA